MAGLFNTKGRASPNTDVSEECVLTINLKRLCLISTGDSSEDIPFLLNQSILRIEVDHRCEELSLAHVTEEQGEIICNQIVHFSLENPTGSQVQNDHSISFSLVRKLVLLQIEETIAQAEFPLSQLIIESPLITSGSMVLYGDNDVSVITLTVGVCLNYGCLGYGNSLIAGKTEQAVLSACEYSLFPRLHSTGDKHDGTGYHRMPIGVPKPSFVPFQHSASFYNSYPASPISSSVSPRGPDLKLISGEMKRLSQLCYTYHQTYGRQNKLEFLRSLVKDLSSLPETSPASSPLHLQVKTEQNPLSTDSGLHRRKKQQQVSPVNPVPRSGSSELSLA